jgi:NAD(P)-dependent dehydrogenase (short-subunit alcohol dehydrogenase family)
MLPTGRIVLLTVVYLFPFAAFPSVQKANLGVFVADFGDLKQVKVAAETFVASEIRLDILVNNAGFYVDIASRW